MLELTELEAIYQYTPTQISDVSHHDGLAVGMALAQKLNFTRILVSAHG